MIKRWLLRTSSVLVVLLVGLGVFAWVRSASLLQRAWQVNESPLVVPNDATAIQRGHHLGVTRGCTDCHAADMGGRVVVANSPIGQLAAPNLTRGNGGVGASLSVNNWERAIRHGLRPDGRPLLLMPSDEMAALTDSDTADLIAWLRQVPPVDRATPPSYVAPLGRVLMAFGQLPLTAASRIDQHAVHQTSIVPMANAAYGAYLAHNCIGCHGARLSGGRIPGMPPQTPKAANLTPDPGTGLGKWSKADFYRALREGRRPDGRALDPFMPWKTIGLSSDTELDALWAYLRSVPPMPAGQR